MRFLATTAAVVCVGLLFGCSKPGGPPGATASLAANAIAPSPAPSKSTAGTPPPTKAIEAPVTPAATLAYAYAYELRAQPKNIAGLLARHEAACADAGPAVCQVTGSTMEAHGHDDVHATLSLRGAPGWIARFRDQLAADAKSAGGRVAHATVTSEDLSRQVIDAQAAIRAKTALRDRLQTLLETRPGKTADFLEIATDLSNAQSDLDATKSELAAMQQRLETSTLTIDYVSSGVLTPEGAWAPLASAVSQASGIVAGTLALMVTCIAALAPWAVVVGIGVWLFRGRAWRPKPGSETKGAAEIG